MDNIAAPHVSYFLLLQLPTLKRTIVVPSDLLYVIKLKILSCWVPKHFQKRSITSKLENQDETVEPVNEIQIEIPNVAPDE